MHKINNSLYLAGIPLEWRRILWFLISFSPILYGGVRCKVILDFDLVGKILWCDHSTERSLVVLSHYRAIYMRKNKTRPK